MDPVSVLLAAVLAGAGTGASRVVSHAVSDAYDVLRTRLHKRFSQHAQPAKPGPDQLLAAYEEDPDTWEAPLAKALRQVGADRDEELLDVARGLLRTADPEGTAAGKYTVDARGAQGVQIGDHGQMQVNVTARPPAERGDT